MTVRSLVPLRYRLESFQFRRSVSCVLQPDFRSHSIPPLDPYSYSAGVFRPRFRANEVPTLLVFAADQVIRTQGESTSFLTCFFPSYRIPLEQTLRLRKPREFTVARFDWPTVV